MFNQCLLWLSLIWGQIHDVWVSLCCVCALHYIGPSLRIYTCFITSLIYHLNYYWSLPLYLSSTIYLDICDLFTFNPSVRKIIFNFTIAPKRKYDLLYNNLRHITLLCSFLAHCIEKLLLIKVFPCWGGKCQLCSVLSAEWLCKKTHQKYMVYEIKYT